MRIIFKTAAVLLMFAAMPALANETIGTSESPIVVSQGDIFMPTTVPQPKPLMLDAD